MTTKEIVDIIKKSGLFDENYYLEQYGDVKQANYDPILHYVNHGATEGRNPSPNFDTTYYLNHYPEVTGSGLNPLVHYIQYGQKKGWLPRSPLVAVKGEAKTAAIKKRLQEIKSEFPKVLSTTETLEHLIAKGASIARFGDGELAYCLGIPQYYQAMDERLQKRLMEILSAPYNEKCLIGIMELRSPDDKLTFSEVFYLKHFEMLKPLLRRKTYGETNISRSFVFYENPLAKIKSLWRDRDVVFVYGKGGRFYIHEELFDNVNSYETIYTPATNAFSDYDDILNQCLSHSESKLFLLACGLTSTVLAYDLSLHGYQALDIGHLPNSYDAYRGRIKIAEALPFEGNAPSAAPPIFDRTYYLNRYKDVARSGINPFEHYIRHGKKEGRSPCPNQVSIVIPHKNSVDSLAILLKSIKEETSSVDVFIVDDHSELEELAKWKHLKEDYPSYCFLINEGKYPGVARNTALKRVVTKWVLFADADDYFLPGWYNEVSEHFQSGGDMVYFPPTSKNLQTGKLGTRHLGYEHLVLAHVGNPAQFDEEIRLNMHPPWSKLIRVDFLHQHGFAFGEEQVSNDMIFSLKAGFLARKITSSKTAIYCVTEGASTLTTFHTLDRLKVRGKVVRQYNDFLTKNYQGRGNYQLGGKHLHEAAAHAGLSSHEIEILLDYLQGLGLKL